MLQWARSIGGPTMAIEKTLFTADDLFRLPDGALLYELVRGEVAPVPPAGGEHGFTAGELLGLVREYVRPRRSGLTFTVGTGFLVARDPDTVRAPDIAFIANGRLSDNLPPIGVVEVV